MFCPGSGQLAVLSEPDTEAAAFFVNLKGMNPDYANLARARQREAQAQQDGSSEAAGAGGLNATNSAPAPRQQSAGNHRTSMTTLPRSVHSRSQLPPSVGPNIATVERISAPNPGLLHLENMQARQGHATPFTQEQLAMQYMYNTALQSQPHQLSSLTPSFGDLNSYLQSLATAQAFERRELQAQSHNPRAAMENYLIQQGRIQSSPEAPFRHFPGQESSSLAQMHHFSSLPNQSFMGGAIPQTSFIPSAQYPPAMHVPVSSTAFSPVPSGREASASNSSTSSQQRTSALPARWLHAGIMTAFSIDDQNTGPDGTYAYTADIIDECHLFHYLKRVKYPHLTPKQYRAALRKVVREGGPGYTNESRECLDSRLLRILQNRVEYLGRAHWGFKKYAKHGLDLPAFRAKQKRAEESAANYSIDVRTAIAESPLQAEAPTPPPRDTPRLAPREANRQTPSSAAMGHVPRVAIGVAHNDRRVEAVPSENTRAKVKQEIDQVPEREEDVSQQPVTKKARTASPSPTKKPR